METITPEAVRAAAELLGIRERASLNDIRRHYYEQMKEWHPDVSRKDSALSHEMTIRLKEAYDLLVSYGMNYSFSFRMEDLKKDREISSDEYWTERFGDDPIWG